MKNVKKMFLITGANGGLGHAFAEAALQAGHHVVGTVRREDVRIKRGDQELGIHHALDRLRLTGRYASSDSTDFQLIVPTQA